MMVMTLFDMNEASDLSPRDQKALKAAIEAELEAREAKRQVAKRRPGRTL
jgi:hypothetical protein